MNILKWDRNLQVRIIGETINSILFWMFFPFMTLYFKGLFGDKLTGLVMMIPPIVGVIANLYGGYAADKYGRKKMMVLSLGFQSVLLFIFAMSSFPWVDYLAFIGLALFGSIYRPASMAMVADLVPVKERRSVFAAFYTSINIGVVFGPMLGSIFFFSYRKYLILTSAVVTFSLFLIMMKVLKETLPNSAKLLAAGHTIKKQLYNYSIIFKDKIFLIFIISGILISQVFMQLDLFLSVYLVDHFPVQDLDIGFFTFELTGEKMFGWLVSENGFLVVVFGVIIARLTRKWSDQMALIISSILFGLSFWLFAFTTHAQMLLILMGLFTLAELIRTPVMQNFVTDYAPENKRGQYLGASALQFSVGRMIAPLAVTFAAFFKPIVIFSGIFLSSLIGAILYKVMFNYYKKEEN